MIVCGTGVFDRVNPFVELVVALIIKLSDMGGFGFGLIGGVGKSGESRAGPAFGSSATDCVAGELALRTAAATMIFNTRRTIP
jgi:hypothetical protein